MRLDIEVGRWWRVCLDIEVGRRWRVCPDIEIGRRVEGVSRHRDR